MRTSLKMLMTMRSGAKYMPSLEQKKNHMTIENHDAKKNTISLYFGSHYLNFWNDFPKRDKLQTLIFKYCIEYPVLFALLTWKSSNYILPAQVSLNSVRYIFTNLVEYQIVDGDKNCFVFCGFPWNTANTHHNDLNLCWIFADRFYGKPQKLHWLLLAFVHLIKWYLFYFYFLWMNFVTIF